MKTIRSIGVLVSCFVGGSVFAQVAPDFIGIDTQQIFVQTGNSTTAAATYSAGVSGPYAFVVSVEGEDPKDLSGNQAPTFTVPGGSTYSGSTTLLPTSGTDWKLNNYYSSSPSSTDFPNGTYTVTQPGVSGQTVSVNLTGNFFPATPVATITGGSGTWSGNTLTVSPGTNLTLTTNTFGWDGTGAETNGALANHIGLFIMDNSSEVAFNEQFSNAAAPYFTSGTGNPNYATANYTFTSGSYFVEMEFNAISAIDTSYSPAKALALYTTRTTFNIQVIPEPSTYAAIFGVMALAGVMIHRRRRTA